MAYEAVLLFGVIFAASYTVLASMNWSYPLAPVPRAALQAVLFAIIGIYLAFCWTRTGQTLALKAWGLKVTRNDGQLLTASSCLARYLLAWHLWLPGIAAGALLDLTMGWTLCALVLGFLLLLTPAVLDPRGRLLHDQWTGTRVICAPARNLRCARSGGRTRPR